MIIFLSCIPYCGDGIIVGIEQEPGHCDDGNSNANDGCTNCLIDYAYKCSGTPSKCSNQCGNGIVEGDLG